MPAVPEITVTEAALRVPVTASQTWRIGTVQTSHAAQ